MVGLARVTVIVLAVFLFLLEFGYSTDTATGLLLDQLSYGLVIAAGFVTLGSVLRAKLREETVRNDFRRVGINHQRGCVCVC